MKLGPLNIKVGFAGSTTQGRETSEQKESPNTNGRANEDGNWLFTAIKSRVPRFNFGKLDPEPVAEEPDIGASNGQPSLDSPLFYQLPAQLQEESKAQPHLWEYLCSLPVADIGVPDFYPQLTRDMRTLKNRNLIYPVSSSVFVHVCPDLTDIRDYYVPIEPSIYPSLQALMQKVDKRLMNYIDQVKKTGDFEVKKGVLLELLDRICTVEGGLRHRGAIKVTERELNGLRYLMIREKGGLGVVEPLLSDKHIEDISCDGVGPIFLEHKVFGGLKAKIYFDTLEELDHFVIKMSERIGRPVTVRDPIIDAVLPDGSRVNIVFGGDVSKRGSNFTIRKFSETPMSILELISLGSLSYEMAGYLSLMLGTGMNTFVCGETASGKTTLLNAITTFLNPLHKIVSIEDTPELQVPHPHWTREVVRGKAEDASSVTMFDLLRAALRQRPNNIIIGEIRGEEGAIAFQAMQTGHDCMATFHASSVEKLLQRLTGSPINVPRTYIDNLNLAIITGAVRLADGTPTRKVLSINEIIGFDSESESFDYIEVFRWNAKQDRFEFPGYMNSRLLENIVAVRRGLSSQESRQLYDEIDDRAAILRRLHERGVTEFYELHKVFSQAHREGLIR